MYKPILAAILSFIPFLSIAQIQGPPEVCVNQVNTYYINPTPQTNFFWFSNSNNVQFLENDTSHVQIKFTESGTYTIFVEAIVDFSIDTVSYQVYVDNISFYSGIEIIEGCYEFDQSSNKAQVCEGSTTVIYIEDDPFSDLENLNIEGANNYLFHYDNGNIITVNWGGPGTGLVAYTMYDICYGFELNFEILPKPDPEIRTNKSVVNDTLEVCRGEQIEFTNMDDPGSNYSWDLGDGTTVATAQVSHAYQEEGIYIVQLNSSQICDCNGSDQIIVKVSKDPAPQLDCINSVCPGTRQKYTAITDGNCNAYQWNISQNGRIIRGGQTQDDFVEIIWESGPDGIIELAVSDCEKEHCATVNSYRVPVISKEGPIEGDVSVCSGELKTYTAPYFPGTAYDWSVSPNGTIIGQSGRSTLTVLWNEVDQMQENEWVRVSYTNCFLECGGEDQLDITISQSLSIESEDHYCQGSSPAIRAKAGFDTSNTVEVQWMIETDAGALIHTGPVASSYEPVLDLPPGNYSWVATHPSPGAYCNDTIRHDFSIIQKPEKPTDIYGADEICPGVLYSYTTPENTYRTEWTITNGSNVRKEQGSVLSTDFESNTPIQIAAQYADLQYPQCISDADTLEIELVSGLEINELSNACQDQRSRYEVRSIDGAHYEWRLEPPTAGEIKKLSKNQIEVYWAEAGNAQIILDVCARQITKNITIRSKPDFTISAPDVICANTTAEIQTDLPSAMHTWRNAEDEIISTNNILRRGPGIYAVNVRDTFGCFAQQSVDIKGKEAPKVEISANNGIIYCSNPDPIRLIASSNEGNTFEWYRNDTALGQTNRVITIDQAGLYRVEAMSSTGCLASSDILSIVDCCPRDKCQNDIICNNPNACPLLEEDLQVDISRPACNLRTYTGMHPDLNTDSSIVRLSTVDGNTIAVYEGNSVSHRFRSPGYYFVVFKGKLNGSSYVQPNCRHTDIIFDSIPAVADFEFNTVCAGNSMSFTNTSLTMPGQNINSHQWDFGDPASGSNNTSTEQNPEHFFAKGGNYDVTLQITTSEGCTAYIIQSVTVHDGFDINIDFPSTHCEKTAIDFVVEQTLLDIEWDFGDPSSGNLNRSVAENPIHTYDEPGVYNIRLQGRNITACRLDTTFSIDILANALSGDIAVDPGLQICEGNTVRLSAPVGGDQWLWSNEDTSASIMTGLGGQYDVFITNSLGCQYEPPSVYIDVLPKPRVKIKGRIIQEGEALAWQDSLFICEGSIVELEGFADDSVSYQWSTGASDKSILFAPEGGTGLSAGTHIIELVGTHTNCASDTAHFYIKVFENPDPAEILLSNGTSCAGDENLLVVNNPDPEHTYHWSDGRTGVSIEATTSGLYYVTSVNENGCAQRSMNEIEILPIPDISQIPGGCFTRCQPLDICLPDLQNIRSYEIYRNDSLLLSGGNLPSYYTATKGGVYQVRIESYNGCQASTGTLELDLAPFVGTHLIQVWSDVNDNGIVDPGDTTIQGIAVEMNQNMIGLPPYQGRSNEYGSFTIHDISGDSSLSYFDRDILPSYWEVVIDSVSSQIRECGDTAVVDLLLVKNCSVQGPDQEFSLCPGETAIVADSILSDTGNYVIHTLGPSGCDSIINVEISLPDSGNIHYSVWSDVDENGVISPADTLIPNINIQIERSGNPKIINSGSSGASDIRLVKGEYLFTLGQQHHQEYDILIDSLFANVPCVEDSLNFLLLEKCEGVTIDSITMLCPGDTIRLGNQFITETGLYTYVTESGRCDTTLQLKVELLEADYELRYEACFGDDIEFQWQGTTNYSIQWSTGDTTDYIEELDAGLYSFTLHYGDCSLEDSVQLMGANIEDISFRAFDPLCPNEASGMIVKGNDDQDLSWGIDSMQLIEGDTIFGLPAGEYGIFIADDNCHTQLPFYIDLFDPELEPLVLQEDLHIQENETIQLTHNYLDSTSFEFTWSPADYLSCINCIQPSFTGGEEDMWIYLDIRTPKGCTLRDSTLITIELLESAMYIPNSFTPNDDGRNDLFQVYVPLDHQLISMSVFDRWGNLLYEEYLYGTNLTFRGWDGTYNGKEVTTGVYIYQVEYRDPSGTKKTEEGSIFLHR